MKISVRQYRVAKIRLADLVAVADCSYSADAESIRKSLIKNFGPMGYGISIFCPRGELVVHEDSPSTAVLVGIEMLGFELDAPNIPFAGVVNADPLKPNEIDRLDGALRAELSRYGIVTFPEQYETRCAYEVRGN